MSALDFFNWGSILIVIVLGLVHYLYSLLLAVIFLRISLLLTSGCCTAILNKKDMINKKNRTFILQITKLVLMIFNEQFYFYKLVSLTGGGGGCRKIEYILSILSADLEQSLSNWPDKL